MDEISPLPPGGRQLTIAQALKPRQDKRKRLLEEEDLSDVSPPPPRPRRLVKPSQSQHRSEPSPEVDLLESPPQVPGRRRRGRTSTAPQDSYSPPPPSSSPPAPSPPLVPSSPGQEPNHHSACCEFEYNPDGKQRFVKGYDDARVESEDGPSMACLICPNHNGGKKGGGLYRWDGMRDHYKRYHHEILSQIASGTPEHHFCRNESFAKVRAGIGRAITEDEFMIYVRVYHENEADIRAVFAWMRLHPVPLPPSRTPEQIMSDKVDYICSSQVFRYKLTRRLFDDLETFFPDMLSWEFGTVPTELAELTKPENKRAKTRCLPVAAIPKGAALTKDGESSYPYSQFQYGFVITDDTGFRAKLNRANWLRLACGMLQPRPLLGYTIPTFLMISIRST